MTDFKYPILLTLVEFIYPLYAYVGTVYPLRHPESDRAAAILSVSPQTLMTSRHPDLLRLLSWRQTSSRLELVTEPVRPLAERRPRLTELDVSAGLLAVLRALHFLHQQVCTPVNGGGGGGGALTNESQRSIDNFMDIFLLGNYKTQRKSREVVWQLKSTVLAGSFIIHIYYPLLCFFFT